jgi:hypothetical protein
MTTTTSPAPRDLITAPEGTLVTYSYPYRGELVTVTGRKGRAINPGQSAGFEIVNDAGEVVGRTSRYTRVTFLPEA